jgi:hypothetical protein
VSAPSPPTPAALARLATKYRTLADLRRRRAAGEAVPPRAVFRELAREFPGALNELDTLLLDDIDARGAALEAAAAGGELAPWMAWLEAYHALSRAALRIKLRLGGQRAVDDARAAALADEASEHAAIAVDAAFARAVARPPRGRAQDVVFAALAARFEVPEETVRDALFPRRRAARARDA